MHRVVKSMGALHTRTIEIQSIRRLATIYHDTHRFTASGVSTGAISARLRSALSPRESQPHIPDEEHRVLSRLARAFRIQDLDVEISHKLQHLSGQKFARSLTTSRTGKAYAPQQRPSQSPSMPVPAQDTYIVHTQTAGQSS